jgi:AcrR family transcriptional regulator
MLGPGLGVERGAVERSQRERLLAATVATVAEKGYGATSIADLTSLAGVSRRAFYEHFPDKQACFLAAVDEIVAAALGVTASCLRGKGPGEERARGALERFFGLLAEQPAASKVCFVDLYAAGPVAMARMDGAIADFGALLGAALQEMPAQAGMPAEIARAMVGGLRKVIRTRLQRGHPAQLGPIVGELWELGMAYPRPPAPLRRPKRRVSPAPGRSEPADAAERIVRGATAAVAAKGYPATRITDIARASGASLHTFYGIFDSKQDAVAAALDAGSARLLAATLPAFRRIRDWPAAVRAAAQAMFCFLACEPDLARLLAVEVYAAGPEALEARDREIEGLGVLLAPGFERSPATPPIAPEAIGGAIYGLVHDQVRHRGPESLLEVVPLATYIALAPFIGAQEACEVANSGWRERRGATSTKA